MVVLAVGAGLLGVAPAFAADGVVISRGAAVSATYRTDSAKKLTLGVPAQAQAGDVLVASIGFRRAGAKSQPRLRPPEGWKLVSRINHGTAGALAVYWHVFTAGETSYAWRTDVKVGGIVFLAAFGGVDTANPIDVSAGAGVSGKGRPVSAPSVTTSVAGEALVSSYFAYKRLPAGVGSCAKLIPRAKASATAKARRRRCAAAASTTWKAPRGMNEIGDANNGAGHSGSLDARVQATAGASGKQTATSSIAQDAAVAVLSALRPAAGSPVTTPPGGPVTTPPVVVPPPGGPPVTPAPVISNVAASSVTTTGATIVWTTDQASDSQVDYGITGAYGSSTLLSSTRGLAHSRALTGLTAGTRYHYRVKSRNAAGTLATSADFTFQTSAAPIGGVPLIVDTDIFSDAGDVGALATAFALQLKGEAHVIAIGVNTRIGRPVATNSWRCAAAVAQFYRAGSTPIGTDMPNNGTGTNTLDFIGPCAALASPATPSPQSAVSVFRQALAGQADNSVVMFETGYSENLAALLGSSGDTISPLSGRNLVAQKVKMLVIMAGGYPSRIGENNLIGNPAAAQTVSAAWPTKIVWAGYEVGDAVHTGQTISTIHPANSPVRVAYEAFVGPSDWIYSYDLVAAYYAARQGGVLTEVGPGANSIDASGGNAFTPGAGSQYYLQLSNASALDLSIETLLDTLP